MNRGQVMPWDMLPQVPGNPFQPHFACPAPPVGATKLADAWKAREAILKKKREAEATPYPTIWAPEDGEAGSAAASSKDSLSFIAPLVKRVKKKGILTRKQGLRPDLADAMRRKQQTDKWLGIAKALQNAGRLRHTEDIERLVIEITAKKATGTLRSRGDAIHSYMQWARDNDFAPFPVDRTTINT